MEWTSQSATGARQTNEDRWGQRAVMAGGRVRSTGVICDGIGGMTYGERAAELARDAFLGAHSFSAGLQEHERMDFAVYMANNAVREDVEANPGRKGMGTTLAAASVDEATLVWTSVGDSTVWIWRRRTQQLHRLSEPHHRADAPNRLTSAIVGEPINEESGVDRGWLGLYKGDHVILASDGVDTLTRRQIQAVVTRAVGAGKPIAQEVIRAVLNVGRPEQDNVTIASIEALKTASTRAREAG